MFSHVMIGTNDLEKAKSFYDALLGTLGVGAISALLLFAYELALARVPQHRAALERLVRAQTGLDVRFTELGLRWGWYGPEAVFHAVSFRESARGGSLLRAPQLVVGLDLWRMVRSGHLEAGRRLRHGHTETAKGPNEVARALHRRLLGQGHEPRLVFQPSVATEG